MGIYIALFRGINVGGQHRLPMKDLVSVLVSLGAESVKTYIQSGNAVFRYPTASADGMAAAISEAIQRRHGFSPRVLLVSRGDLEQAIADNPFPQAQPEPKSLHLYFLSEPALQVDWATMAQYKKDNEAYALKGNVFYLHAPDGIGRSKLAERVEKCLGVSVTARNWRTVEQIFSLARAVS